MRLVAYTDDKGFDRLAWLRERDPDEEAANLGIPHDPPDLDSMNLPEAQTKKLHNALVARRLVAWANSTDFKRGLAECAHLAGLDDEQTAQLKRLYASGPPPKPGLAWDLDTALEALPVGDRQRECIKQTFAQAGIRNLAGVENAPTRVGHICNMDIYWIIAHLLGKEV